MFFCASNIGLGNDFLNVGVILFHTLEALCNTALYKFDTDINIQDLNLVISACSCDILDMLCIFEIDRKQLRNSFLSVLFDFILFDIKFY